MQGPPVSLYDPPHLDPRVYVACTCRGEFFHLPTCATQDPKHPAWEKARETVERNWTEWNR